MPPVGCAARAPCGRPHERRRRAARRARTLAVALALLLFTLLIIGALFLFGPHHPPTLNDEVPLARGRLVLAGFALFMLVVCFTSAPIELFVTGQ